MNTLETMKRIGCLVLAFAAVNTGAQSGGPFTLNWSSIDGGGSAAAGGQFALNGTIGQPDAGEMSGSPYALTGGFWSLVAVPSGPIGPPPHLSIERLPGGAVRVFWTRPADGYVLEEVGAITRSPVTGWSLVPPSAYQTNATHVSITLPMPTGMRVYRIRRL